MTGDLVPRRRGWAFFTTLNTSQRPWRPPATAPELPPVADAPAERVEDMRIVSAEP